MSAPGCEFRAQVDGHFGAGLSPEREHALRGHLVGCEGCRAYYERHALLAKLDPSAPSAQDRLARGLGIQPPRVRWLSLPVALPVGFAAAAAALLLVVGPMHKPSDDGFASRGGNTALPSVDVRVYQVVAGKAQPVTGPISPGSELAFSYVNRAAKKYLMIYGVDEHRHVYWFYPSWTDASADPAAVPALAGETQRELPEAITQKLDGTSLHIEALFLDAPLTVKQVEAQLAAGSPHIDGALSWTRELQVAAP